MIDHRAQSRRVRIAVWFGTILPLPFIVGAFVLGWRLARLPDDAEIYAKFRLLSGMLFALGFALGLRGAILALVYPSRSQRIAEIAVVVFGCGNIVAAFNITRFISAGNWPFGDSVLGPLIVPVVLWIFSILLMVNSARLKRSEAVKVKAGESKEEQPLHLSLP